MCGIYEGNHLFSYTPIETVYIKDHPDTELDWLRVLGPLTSSELIFGSEEEKIHVEEVYLEKAASDEVGVLSQVHNVLRSPISCIIGKIAL